MDIMLQSQEIIDLNRVSADFVLTCQSGRIWVTCEGDLRDYLLRPGMEYQGLKRGKVVVCALTPARLSFTTKASALSSGLLPLFRQKTTVMMEI